MRPKETNHKELLDQAKLKTNRRRDGAFVEQELLDNLASLIEANSEEERIGIAKNIVEYYCMPGHTKPRGQIKFPGRTPYANEPDRLIRDDHGAIIELDKATLEFTRAEANRAREYARAVTERFSRKCAELGFSPN
jgi:hypothetical protein